MPNTKSNQKTAIEITKSLLKIGSELQKIANRITGKYGLNQQQFVILNEIVRNKQISQKQIVGELLFEKSNVSKIVKKLQHLQLIAISNNQNDARFTLLTATNKGKNIWKQCIQELDDWNIEWLQPLSQDELEPSYQVLKTLEKLF